MGYTATPAIGGTEALCDATAVLTHLLIHATFVLRLKRRKHYLFDRNVRARQQVVDVPVFPPAALNVPQRPSR